MNRTSTPDILPETLVFRPVDLGAHLDTCMRFRSDPLICAVGSAKRFNGRDGQGAQPGTDCLRTRAQRLPGCLVHLWRGDTIIGQVEMSLVPSDHTLGRIDLLYLLPEARGQGLGRLLEAYAWTYLSGLGCRALCLAASPANRSAWRFLSKQGWQDLGPEANDAKVHRLEKREQDLRPVQAPAPVWATTAAALQVPFTLETERLCLVPPDSRLTGPLAAALNASYPLHRDFLPWSKARWSVQDTAQSLEAAARDYFLPQGEKRFFVCSREAAPQLLGCIGLSPRIEEGACYEIGYWASQPHAGNGYMKEALAALMATLREHSLYLTTSSANIASQRLAVSVGLRNVDVIVGARHSETFGVGDTLVYRRQAVIVRGDPEVPKH